MDYEINKRILEVRKYLKLSQTAFGERIGVSRGVINNLDLCNTTVKPLMINQICKEFKINKIWLETGEGEMFSHASEDEEIAYFMGSVLAGEPESFKKRFMAMLAALDEEGWELLAKMAETLAGGKQNDDERNGENGK